MSSSWLNAKDNYEKYLSKVNIFAQAFFLPLSWVTIGKKICSSNHEFDDLSAINQLDLNNFLRILKG